MRCAMISIKNNDRLLIRDDTLRQLNDLQIIPQVFYSDKPLGLKNHTEASKKALNFLLKTGGLFLEDDLKFSDKFLHTLSEVAACKFSPVALYVPGKSFLPAPVRRGEFGIKKLVNSTRFFGSQAIYLSSATIGWLLDNWIDNKFFDTQLQRLTIYGYFPNPVQHAGAALPSTWSKYGKPHRSVTYVY